MRITLMLALVACGGGGQSPPDGTNPPDDGDGACGKDEVFVQGELVDWDSSPAGFEGVFGATLTVLGTSVSVSTPPNGRIELCVPAFFPVRFDLDGPTDYLDGSFYLEGEALGGRALSLRTITSARAPSFYTERGLTFDANKAHVVVFLAGDGGSLTLDRTHDATQAGIDDGGPGTVTWKTGDAGRYVLFPNVDVTQATATITGDTSGPHVVPLEAGKLTLAAISFVFL